MTCVLDTKQTRIVKKTVPCESFFNFFSPPKAPDDEDEDAASDIEERLELDYTLGEDMKEKLIPRAIDWFTGEALQFEDEIEEDIEGDFEDEDDEDDEDASEERDDDEESDEEVRFSSAIASIPSTDTLFRMTEPSQNKRPLNANRVSRRIRKNRSQQSIFYGEPL